jgi:hypothetical protein
VDSSRVRADVELRGTKDIARWGTSLANAAEILMPILEAAGVRSVAEIGAYQGDFTAELLAWAQVRGVSVLAIDPTPGRDLAKVAERYPKLELVRERSHDALRHIDLPDAVVVDGDHNYYTVDGELRLIAERSGAGPLPLIILHDVLWPHGRRDTYYAPDEIPAEHRQPVREDGRILPENPGIARYGFPYRWPAEREGGPRNGVLTAVEDFVEGREEARLAILPMFFGIGVLWSASAAYSDDVGRLLEPWDRNPVLMRLEHNRIYHLTREFALVSQLLRQERVLRAAVHSRAFALAGRLSRLRHRGDTMTWTEDLRDALDSSENGDLSHAIGPPPPEESQS